MDFKIVCIKNRDKIFVEMHETAVWIFMLLLSAGSVVPHAAILAWIDDHIGLKGIVSVMFNLTLSVGEMINSPLIGFFFEKVSYMAFIYYTLGGTLLCLTMMIILAVLGKKYKQMKEALYDTLGWT